MIFLLGSFGDVFHCSHHGCAPRSAAAADAPEDEDRPPPVEFQPESVAGEMREYQLEGLKWLVARYDDGINAILADEMVRRHTTGTARSTSNLYLWAAIAREPILIYASDVSTASSLRLTPSHCHAADLLSSLAWCR